MRFLSKVEANYRFVLRETFDEESQAGFKQQVWAKYEKASSLKMKNKVTSKYTIVADFDAYKEKTWVHYSRHGQMKFNYTSHHSDPVGIYFFPEGFKTAGSWHTLPYKYTAKIKPDAKVLDMAKIKTKEDAFAFLKLMKIDDVGLIEKTFNGYSDPTRAAWKVFTNVYVGEKAKMNSLLRAAGYDAVFDDTNSIFNGETQLIVLDPKALTDVNQTVQGDTGYREVAKARGVILEALKAYDGKVLSAPSPKKKKGFGSDPSKIECKIKFVADESTRSYESPDGKNNTYPTYGREIEFKIETSTFSMSGKDQKKRPATEVHIYAEGSSAEYQKHYKTNWNDNYKPSALSWRLEEFAPNEITSWVQESMKMLWDDTFPGRKKAEWEAKLKKYEEEDKAKKEAA